MNKLVALLIAAGGFTAGAFARTAAPLPLPQLLRPPLPPRRQKAAKTGCQEAAEARQKSKAAAAKPAA